MRRILCALTFALAVGVLLAVAADPAAASPPAATYGPVTLSVDTNCNFTASARWSHSKVDSVQFTLRTGPVASDTATVTPKGRKAVAPFGLAIDLVNTHSFQVEADFYVNGVDQAQLFSNSINAACAFLL